MSFKVGTNSNLIYKKMKKINTGKASGNKTRISIIRLSASSVTGPERVNCPTAGLDKANTEFIEVIPQYDNLPVDQSSGDAFIDQPSSYTTPEENLPDDQPLEYQPIVECSEFIDPNNQEHTDYINSPDVTSPNNQSSGDQSQSSQEHIYCINSPDFEADENNQSSSKILHQVIINKIKSTHSGLSKCDPTGSYPPAAPSSSKAEATCPKMAESSSDIQALLTKHHIKNRIRQLNPT